MNVIVQHEDKIAENKEISINDEHFDVPGWINLHVGEETVEVHVTELNRALLPFLESYHRQMEEVK